MSNHHPVPPPPNWGPPLQPYWTPQPPLGSIPQNSQSNPDLRPNTEHYQNLHNFYANANLPGLGGAGVTGTFPPAFAFPGGFPFAATPPQFATIPPGVNYPHMPAAPSSQSQAQQAPDSSVHSTQPSAPHSQPTTTTSSRPDFDREEGELTDIEAPKKIGQKPHIASNIGQLPQRHGADSVRGNQTQMAQAHFSTANSLSDKASTLRHESLSELEEGEASPEPRASSRDSGSPYNPSLPTNAESSSLAEPLPEAPKEPLGANNPTFSASKGSHASSGTPPSLVQLRVQAQGALLSLAPHSIRYNELVGEGINPAILKQLYEEVGIKVPNTPTTPSAGKAVSSENVHPATNLCAANHHANQSTQSPESRINAAPVLAPVEPSPTPPQSSQLNTSKPMERKEVIARMLAAKAAKSSPAAAPLSEVAETTQSSQDLPAVVEQPATSGPLSDVSANEKESRIKEKNKAQTELARQRIEQLKKQGLMRNLQKLQTDNQVLDKDMGTPAPQAQSSTIVHHPLPERPPLPESMSVDQIPGLFITEQESEATNDTHESEVNPQPRSVQRKRPRASDFDDDPIPVPKRVSSNGTNFPVPERLVIDISDDEFYGDDEDQDDAAEARSTAYSKDSTALPAEGLLRPYPSSEILPHRPATSPSQGFSASASTTPNGNKSNEQEHLRKKDLEIQAMHRRIAELEQRKKAKLASRTQSPRASGLSTPEPVTLPTVSAPALPDLEQDVQTLLATMDADGLRRMKSKVLRVQEIEAGVPSLDAEIQKSETKLAATRREEEKLSTELAKGREGRQQLLGELSALKLEVAGLSLDQINAALIDMETKQQLPVETVQGMLRRLSIPGLQHTNTTTHAVAVGYENEASANGVGTIPETSETDVQIQDAPSQHRAAARSPTPGQPLEVPPVVETSVSNPVPAVPSDTSMSDTSMSEDSSSSMDESSGDSSSDSETPDEDMADAQDPVTNSAAPAGPNAESAESANGADGPQVEGATAVESQPAFLTVGEEDPSAKLENVPREPSVSDTYEPPEPEESGSASDSSYSPPPSPDFPSLPANMEVSGPSEDQSHEAGEPLTEKVQESDAQEPTQHSQIGLLDNARRPEDLQHKFSPYSSPLKMFKAYRYHPNYNDNVPNGYRSLTYSHNIDPLKYLCPFETSGGVCNDRSCEHQHFRDIALSDDKILVQMSSLREGMTTEESDKYVAGLKEIIHDMRRDKVKDMNTVATEIAAYRRRFFQDPTRVLAL
ncbi:hypothetical protein BDV18DRAFT_132983 [Aspergillus unguis]